MAVLVAAHAYSLHVISPIMLDAVSSQPLHAAARRALRHLGMFSLISMPFFSRVRYETDTLFTRKNCQKYIITGKVHTSGEMVVLTVTCGPTAQRSAGNKVVPAEQ
jgi:hypothetical protein